ncbi:MAG: hypothetical protein V1698_03075 [bacterium]
MSAQEILKMARWRDSANESFKKGVHFLFNHLIKPISENEDLKRVEFILNVILLGSLAISLMAFFDTVIYCFIQRGDYQGAPPIVLFAVVFVFLSLLVFSRLGFFKFSSYLLVIVYFLAAFYTIFNWGIDIPQGLLIYVVIIVISGILIGAKFSFWVSFFVSVVMLSVCYLQKNDIVKPALFWRSQKTSCGDVIVYIVTFFIIFILSWLSNREIEKSLKRARESEKALKLEKDNLEKRVEEKTRELKNAQLEKMAQLYQFAEFGRIAGGIFT